MHFPPKNDPRRPVVGAAVISFLNGLIFFTLSGVCLCCGKPMAACILLSIGAGYVACGYYVNRLQNWAVIVGLSLTSPLMFLLFYGLIEGLPVVLIWDLREMALEVGLWLLTLLCLAVLCVHFRYLILCFEAIESLRRHQRGFDVLPLQDQ